MWGTQAFDSHGNLLSQVSIVDTNGDGTAELGVTTTVTSQRV
jgi:hypothetical protein